MSRSVFYKCVSEEHRNVYETVKEAQQSAIDKVKPGTVMCAVDKTAKDVMCNAGYEVLSKKDSENRRRD